MTRVAAILLLLCALSSEAAGTYYIDYAAGNDSNNGLSTGSPWQRAPYMRGFSGTYTHAAGDHIIFKGGVTWPATCLSLYLTNGGSSGNIDYYGTNAAWFAGAAWSMPVFDGTASGVDAMKGDALIHCGFNDYITIDSIVFSNANWSTGASVYYITGMPDSGAGDVTVTNCCFGNPYPVGGGGDSFKCIYGYSGGGIGKVTHCYFTGMPSNAGVGYATYCVQTWEYNTVNYLPNGYVGPCALCQHNSISYIQNSLGGANHPNAIEIFGAAGGIVRDNYVFNCTPSGGCELFDLNCLSGNQLVYDNVVYGNASGQQGIVLDPSPGSSFGSETVWNNTLQDPGNLGYIRVEYRSGGQFTAVAVTNVFCLTTQTGGVVQADGGVTTPISTGNNLQILNTTATADGYTLANLYQPTASGNPTVGAGANMSAFAAANSLPAVDILGTAFPAAGAWDIGAYQYVAPPPDTTAAASLGAWQTITVTNQ